MSIDFHLYVSRSLTTLYTDGLMNVTFLYMGILYLVINSQIFFFFLGAYLKHRPINLKFIWKTFSDGKPFYECAKNTQAQNKTFFFSNFRGSCYKLRRLLSTAQNELVTLNLNRKFNTYTHHHNNNNGVSKHTTPHTSIYTRSTGTLKLVSLTLSHFHQSRAVFSKITKHRAYIFVYIF